MQKSTVRVISVFIIDFYVEVGDSLMSMEIWPKYPLAIAIA